METKWRVLAVVGFGTYMATMDFNIVNVAMPTLAKEFDRSPDTVLWATLASNLVVTGLTLTAGRAGDLFGRKRLYVIGWLIFTAGMATAGLAQNVEQLIAFRFFQAIGVALAIANGNAIVTDAFPASERGRALGTMGAIVGAGLMSGPIFGGLILNVFSWHAIFYLRVPIGVAAMVAAFLFIHEPKRNANGQKLDIPGAVALFFVLSGTLLAVNRGGSWGWDSPVILGLFALGAVALVAFLRIEARSPSPIVSLALFRVRSFSASVVALVLNFLGQSASIFLMPFYLVEIQGYSTARTGLIIATIPLLMLLLSSFSGYASDRWNFRFQTTVGSTLVMVGLLSLATLEADTPVAMVVARLAIIGVGTSIFMAPNTSSIMGSVPRSMLGTASAATATGRNVGNAAGLAMSGAILVGVASSASGISGAGAADLPPEALLDGIRVAFLVSGLVTGLAVIATLFRGGEQTSMEGGQERTPGPVLATATAVVSGGSGEHELPRGMRAKSQHTTRRKGPGFPL
jgi:EmrB/QacA subfamily drug resistance transporter